RCLLLKLNSTWANNRLEKDLRPARFASWSRPLSLRVRPLVVRCEAGEVENEQGTLACCHRLCVVDHCACTRAESTSTGCRSDTARRSRFHLPERTGYDGPRNGARAVTLWACRR